MNYRKIDGALAAALNECQDEEGTLFEVFIHTDQPADHAIATYLQEMGVTGTIAGRTIFTASLDLQQIDQLTEQSWVRFLRLSRQLRLGERKQ